MNKAGGELSAGTLKYQKLWFAAEKSSVFVKHMLGLKVGTLFGMCSVVWFRKCAVVVVLFVRSLLKAPSSCNFYRSIYGLFQFVFYGFTCFPVHLWPSLCNLLSDPFRFLFPLILFTVIAEALDDPASETMALYSLSSISYAALIDFELKGAAWSEMSLEQLRLQMIGSERLEMICFSL